MVHCEIVKRDSKRFIVILFKNIILLIDRCIIKVLKIILDVLRNF
jgi:hypothetical protein